MIEEDTITAIATPIGVGGIGIVKISGPKAKEIALRLFSKKAPLKSHHLYYGEIIDPKDGFVVDEVLLSFMQGPHTYTREDIVEINCHSGYIVLQKILELVLKEGARLAEPGEFTKRAFLNGRIDLTQAEAIADLIQSKSEEGLKYASLRLQGLLAHNLSQIKEDLLSILASLETSIDFPEEDLENLSSFQLLKEIERVRVNIEDLLASYEKGRIFREGISVTIIGRPNVGKSSLLNTILGDKRAIVTPIPGTTRDVIEETINFKGIPLRIMDTAGIQEPTNPIAEEGIRLTKEKLALADLLILVIDMSLPLQREDIEIWEELRSKRVVIALNKMDLTQRITPRELQKKFPKEKLVPISALYAQGIERLKEVIFEEIIKHQIESPFGALISRTRHKIALEKTMVQLLRVRDGLLKPSFPELIALDLKMALNYLGEISGETTSEDILEYIFSEFCIGK